MPQDDDATHLRSSSIASSSQPESTLVIHIYPYADDDIPKQITTISIYFHLTTMAKYRHR